MIYVGLVIGLFAFGAIAEEKANPFKHKENLDIVLDEQDCRRLQKQKQVSANYTPGVDIRGKPVKPADIGAGAQLIPLPDVITLPIRINPFTFADSRGLETFLSDPEVSLGEVEVNLLNGDVTINSVKISDQTAALLRDAC